MVYLLSLFTSFQVACCLRRFYVVHHQRVSQVMPPFHVKPRTHQILKSGSFPNSEVFKQSCILFLVHILYTLTNVHGDVVLQESVHTSGLFTVLWVQNYGMVLHHFELLGSSKQQKVLLSNVVARRTYADVMKFAEPPSLTNVSRCI